MSNTIAHANLGNLIGVDPALYHFKYVSPAVQAALPIAHPMASPEAFNGIWRFHDKESDNMVHVRLSANHLAECHAGGAANVLPVSGERILLAVLPSCTCITDIRVLGSKAGTTHRWLDACTEAEGEFILDKTTDPDTTGPVSICEDVVPASASTAAWPAMDIFMGRVSGLKTDPGDARTFQSFLALAAGTAAPEPEICLMGDTGTSSDQWIMWATLAADVPANSYACVVAEVNKGARF